ncbi:hypothetical protein AB0H34_05830 [Saccharopolyspora shandongensis]|uniref:hypothetical protein n=1 Tax=Saccharopolyspora shandongensis TaxID=418495 RepID=UPI0034022A04
MPAGLNQVIVSDSRVMPARTATAARRPQTLEVRMRDRSGVLPRRNTQEVA